jgi:hypothetical protein
MSGLTGKPRFQDGRAHGNDAGVPPPPLHFVEPSPLTVWTSVRYLHLCSKGTNYFRYCVTQLTFVWCAPA